MLRIIKLWVIVPPLVVIFLADFLGRELVCLQLIKKLNDELKEQGFITIAGRVNRQYFQERLYGAGEKQGKEMG